MNTHKDAQTGTTIHVQMNSHYNTNTTSETPTDGHIQLQNTLNIITLEDIRPSKLIIPDAVAEVCYCLLGGNLELGLLVGGV